MVEANGLVCAAGHAFDRAKTGYVNLLPVQKKRSKDPGDSKEMVAARKAFLELGHYQPIVDNIVASLQGRLQQQGLTTTPSLSIFDAGCGEGYYLNNLYQGLLTSVNKLDCVGLDISKSAIVAASKRNKNIAWIVASNANIPTESERFDSVLCLFGFPMFTEFARLLKPKGLMLMVDANADHLIELRRILYPEIHPYEDSLAAGIAGFSLVEEQALNFSFELASQQEIADLLAMTPHMHKASFEGRAAIQKINHLRLTADVKLRWYQKQTLEDADV